MLKLFFGRFYWNPSTTIVDDENPVGQAAFRYEFNDLNGNRIVDPGPSGGLADSSELGNKLSTLGGAGFVTVDPGLTNAYGHEASAHFEQQLADNFSFRASYVHKNSRNGYGVVDLNRAFAYGIPYSYEDRGPDNTAGTGDDQVIGLMDRQPGIPENRMYVNPGAHGLPSPDANYHTVEVALNRRFADRWMFLTSFLHTWANAYMRTTSSTSVGPPPGSTSSRARPTSGRRTSRSGSVRSTRPTGTTNWSAVTSSPGMSESVLPTSCRAGIRPAAGSASVSRTPEPSG